MRGRRPAGVQKYSSHCRGLRPSSRQPRWVEKALEMYDKTECTLAQNRSQPATWSQRLRLQPHAFSFMRAQAFQRHPSTMLAQVRLRGIISRTVGRIKTGGILVTTLPPSRLSTSLLLAQAPNRDRRSDSRKVGRIKTGGIFFLTMLPSTKLAQVPLLPLRTARGRRASAQACRLYMSVLKLARFRCTSLLSSAQAITLPRLPYSPTTTPLLPRTNHKTALFHRRRTSTMEPWSSKMEPGSPKMIPKGSCT